ncbi:MAG TPA: DUF2460 domain-containing protein [Bryobacteraceae bacterium]|nr:DUF2460 domain-containing protein [Bryobacteraceae bacterium]
MATFPLLTTGAVTQYPSARRFTYSTCITRFLDGTEQRFRELKHPVRRWLIQLHNLSATEMASIEGFFEQMQGQFGSFTFIDPWDEAEYSDCSFDQESFSMEAINENRYQGHLVIRNNTL